MSITDVYELYRNDPSEDSFSRLVQATREYAKNIGRTVFSHLDESRYLHACENAATTALLGFKDKYDPQKGSFSTWIYNSIVRDLIDWQREKARRAANLQYGPVSLPGRTVPLEDRFLLEEILTRLTVEEQGLVRLKADGATLQEMASASGVSTATIKRRLKAIVEKTQADLP